MYLLIYTQSLLRTPARARAHTHTHTLIHTDRHKLTKHGLSQWLYLSEHSNFVSLLQAPSEVSFPSGGVPSSCSKLVSLKTVEPGRIDTWRVCRFSQQLPTSKPTRWWQGSGSESPLSVSGNTSLHSGRNDHQMSGSTVVESRVPRTSFQE